MGISVKSAFQNFAKDVESKVIKRAVTLISEAEKAGGDIGNILESVAKSVSEIEVLKKERRSAIYGMVVQGYIIFFVFIAIILIIQFALLPLTAGVAAPSSGFSAGLSGGGGFLGGIGDGGVEETTDISEQIVMPMFFLLLTQSLFTGLIIGKLAEGRLRAGIKHSFIMVALASLIYFGARLVF
jgi:flagellar protein FlaJ